MFTKSVSVSGSIGKQVFATGGGAPVTLRGVNLHSPVSAATVTIREGNASGLILLEAASPSKDSRSVELPGLGLKVQNGLHVKVIGLSSVAYLYID